MGMQRLDYVRRRPWIADFNNMVDAINNIIDRLNKKIEIEEVTIDREVKDFKFFNGEEVLLPYSVTHTLSSAEDASEVFKLYALTFKEMNNITKLIQEGKVVSLTINVTEEVTEKEKKQEIIFETIETIPAETAPKKKKWRKKKNSWN